MARSYRISVRIGCVAISVVWHERTGQRTTSRSRVVTMWRSKHALQNWTMAAATTSDGKAEGQARTNDECGARRMGAHNCHP